MAGEAYIRLALDNLRRAIADKQNEANNLRTKIGALDSERRQKGDQISAKINHNNQEATRSDNEHDRAALMQENLHLEEEKARLEHDFDAQRSQLEQQIRDQENDWRWLQQFIADVQSNSRL